MTVSKMINGQRYTILPDVRKEIASMTKEEAIARIEDHIVVHGYREQHAVKILEALNMAIKALEQPERKRGKWIEFPNLMAYKCSECGRIIQTTDGRRNVSRHYPFCHCGADMRGDSDEN